MLEDGDIQTLISWDETGTYFSVHDPTEFSKSVLPQYFKHNNVTHLGHLILVCVLCTTIEHVWI